MEYINFNSVETMPSAKASAAFTPPQPELVKAFDGELTDLDGNCHSNACMNAPHCI